MFLRPHRSVVVLLLSLLLCGCAAAVKILYPVNDDPLKAKAGVYSLDPTHANIIFSVSHLGFSFHHGRFNLIEGSLELDTNNPETSKLYVRIDAKTIDTNNHALDELLRHKNMLNVTEHPYIVFESDKIDVQTEKRAIISGHLTMAGRHNPFSIEAEFIGSGTNPLTGHKTVGFSGKGTLKRSDYGLTEWLPFVGDEISFVIEAEFIRPN